MSDYGPRQRPAPKVEVVCFHCGKRQLRHAHRAKMSKTHFCDMKCWMAGAKKRFKTRTPTGPREQSIIQNLQEYADRLCFDRQSRGMSRLAYSLFLNIPYGTLKRIDYLEVSPCMTYYLRIGDKTGIWGELGRDARKPKPTEVKPVAKPRYEWSEVERVLDSTGDIWNLSEAARILEMSPTGLQNCVKRHAPEHPRLSRGRPATKKSLDISRNP